MFFFRLVNLQTRNLDVLSKIVLEGQGNGQKRDFATNVINIVINIGHFSAV